METARDLRLSTRLAVAMVTLVLSTTAIVVVLATVSLERALAQRSSPLLIAHAHLIADRIETAIAGAGADAKAFRAEAAGAASTASTDAGVALWRSRLASYFTGQMQAKSYYTRMALISAQRGGRETVRVDRAGADGAIRVAPATLLADADTDGVVNDTTGMAAGTVAFSSADPATTAAAPAFPVVRVATALTEADAGGAGIVAIDVDLGRIIEPDHANAPPGSRILIIDGRGATLFDAPGNRSEASPPFDLARDYPALAAQLAKDDPVAPVTFKPGGGAYRVAALPLQWAGAEELTLVELVPAATLASIVIGAGRAEIAIAAVIVLLVIGLAALITKLLTGSLARLERATAQLASPRDIGALATAGGEVGAIARGFARVTAAEADLADTLAREGSLRRSAESRLQHHIDRERLFSAAVESSDDAILTHDLDGIITAWNPAAEHLYGYDAEEAIGQSTRILVPDDHADELLAMFGSIRAGERIDHFETVRLTKAGRRIKVSLSVSPVRSGNGTILGASKIARDVTERRLSEEKFRLAVEACPGGIVMTDQAGTILLVNAETERLFGYDRSELLGMSVDRLVPKAARVGHAALRGAFTAHPEVRRMGAGRDLNGVRKDGTEFPIEIGLNPIEAPDGFLVLSVIVDISGRKIAEEMFRLAVEACPGGIVVVDGAGAIRMVNVETERLFGYDRADLLGQSVDILLPLRLRGVHPHHRASFAASPGARSMGAGRDLFGLRKDGSEFPVEVGLNPIQTADGPLVLAVVIDISQRKVLEKANARHTQDLKRSNAELEQFAYVAAHDLQEPLRMVASYTELLAGRYAGQLDEKADKYIEYVVQGAKRMQTLITDLLAYARVGTQGKPLVPTDAGHIADIVIQSLGRKIEDLGAEVTCGELPIVEADDVQLSQLFQNLISNALKFRADRPPRIRIDAKLQGAEWVFSVADNGIGIDQQYAERIFQMFQRIHERRLYEGTGIGLAIAKRIVERHGGRIWFESTLGVGTTFLFTLHSEWGT